MAVAEPAAYKYYDAVTEALLLGVKDVIWRVKLLLEGRMLFLIITLTVAYWGRKRDCERGI